jgi:FlaA1/EpsC-like NDP-sugar epimerase
MCKGVNKSVYVSYEKPIKIVDLAEGMIKTSGKDIGIKCIGMKPGEKLTEKYFSKD